MIILKTFRLALFASMLSLGSLSAADSSLGSKVAPFSLKDASAKLVTVTPGSAVLVVTFTSTQCPISNDYNDRMSALHKEYSDKGVQFYFVNSNSTESAKDVAEHVKSAGFPFSVYKDDGSAATALHAEVTPHSFVIDKSGALRYMGAIDDSRNPARIQSNSLKSALDSVLAGKPVANGSTKAFGCTIKLGRRS